MISWMLYALAAGLLVTAAAAALDAIAVATKQRTRFIWLGATITTVLWPCVALLFARRAPIAELAISDGLRASTVQRAGAIVISASRNVLFAHLDTVLLVAWAALTFVLVARLAVAARTIATRRREWSRTRIGDMWVQMSSDTGPAVVGIDPMEVVIPAWTLELDTPLRDLVLRHEDEHRRARDPYLLLASTVLVILMPWNLALIWQARRLRLAIELDCDARVLRTHPHHERYGLLLLAIAQRQSTRAPLVATAMSEPASNLARRIRAMRNATLNVPTRRLVAYGVAAIAAIAVACAIDAPVAPVPEPKAANERAPEPEMRLVENIVDPNDTAGIAQFKLLPTRNRLADEASSFEKVQSPNAEQTRRSKIVADSLTRVQAIIDRYEQLSQRYLATHNPERPTVERGTINDTTRINGELMRTTRTTTRQDGSVATRELMPVTERGVIVARANVDTGRQEVASSSRAAEPERREPQKVNEGQAYYDFQVEKVATLRPGSTGPTYPTILKNAGVEGDVLASVIVQADGTADVGTLKIIHSSHTQFSDAIRDWLQTARFIPADVGGHAVRQMIQLPFQFTVK